MSGKFTQVAWLLLLVSAFTFLAAAGQPGATEAHGLLQAAFERHVTNGLVDYVGISDDKDFTAYLDWLAKFDPETLRNEKDQKAFWINAYNALAIKAVIETSTLVPPQREGQSSKALAKQLQSKRRGKTTGGYTLRLINSVLDVDGFFKSRKYKVAGGKYTLDHIEKTMIFPKFKDPNLHFVLVCAAMSCPALPSRIYSADNLSSQMESVTRDFLNDANKNRLDKEERVLYLSQIFNWYLSDFGGSDAALVESISPFLDEEKREFLKNNKVKIKFLEYDWRLNRQS